MQQVELLRRTTGLLEQFGISYAVVGALASGAWGEPRMTRDIDIVVELTPAQAEQLCGAFPEGDFYVSRTAAQRACREHGQFNVIHPASGNKIDFMVVGHTDWSDAQLSRAKQVPLFPDVTANVAAPEDVILGKLVYYRDGGSEKHLRDIAGILKISGELVDRKYIGQFAQRLGVDEIWQAVVSSCK